MDTPVESKDILKDEHIGHEETNITQSESSGADESDIKSTSTMSPEAHTPLQSPSIHKITLRDLLGPSNIDHSIVTSDMNDSTLPNSDGNLTTISSEKMADITSTSLVDKAAATALPLLEQLSTKTQQANILAEKAAILLGLARKFENSSRGKALQADAEDFLRFAGEIRESEEGSDVVQRAQDFADLVMDKYESHGKGLFLESQRVWDDLMKSTEAEEFLHSGENILQGWLQYGESEEGRKLVETLQNTIFSSVSENGDGLLALAESYSNDADAWLGAMNKNKATVQRGIDEIRKTVEDDEEIAEWIEQGKKIISEKTKIKKKGNTEVSDDSQSPSSPGSPDGLPTPVASGDDTDTVGEITTAAHEKLQEFQQSDVGKKALKKGAEVLKTLQEEGDLNPDTVIKNLKNLQDDPKARQDLVTKVKDAALEFLLSYLPEVKVPPLKEDTVKASYSLANIDLSGFKLKSQDVDVILTDSGVIITAKNISCTMRNLQWTYKANKFPYVGSDGEANAIATNCSIRIILDVERSLRVSQNGKVNGVGVVELDELDNQLDMDDFLADTTDEEGSLDDNSAEMAVAGAKSPSRPAQTKPIQTTQTTQTNIYDNTTDVKGVLTEDESLTTPVVAEFTDSQQKVVNTINDVFKYNYELILLRERRRKIVEMPHLEIEVTKNWLSSVMNVVITLLREKIRGYVEQELNNAVLKHSGRLLSTVNEFASEYLPLFASVKDKVIEKAPKLVNIASKTINEIQENVKQEAISEAENAKTPPQIDSP